MPVALEGNRGTAGWPAPGLEHATTERALRKFVQAGRILVAAGALDHDDVTGFEKDLHAAITVRSRLLLNREHRRGNLFDAMFAQFSHTAPPSRPVSQAMWVTPIGRALRVDTGRVPSVLHLISLVRTDTTLAVITVAMRMHEPPPDDRETDLEIARVMRHLLSGQLWAADDQGTRYAVRFEGYREGTASWLGIARLEPRPPPGARRLDLFSGGTRLIRLPPGSPVVRATTEPVSLPPAERLLVLEAERILASGNARGPAQGPSPGETITVLTETGAIAASSLVPGQLAALCQRLGVAGHGITAPPAAQIPAPWASVIAHRDAPVPADDSDACAPLNCVLPDVDGATVRPGRAEHHRGREPSARDQQWHAAAHGPVRSQLDAGFLLVAQGRHRELARGERRKTALVYGRHAGVPAAADAAARRGPGHGRDRGDRTGDASPRHHTDSPGPENSED